MSRIHFSSFFLRFVSLDHQAFQQAALLNNNLMPWRSADPWGRPSQRTLLRPRQCYDGAPVKVLPSSQAWLATNEDTVLVAGDVLPIMNHKWLGVSWVGQEDGWLDNFFPSLCWVRLALELLLKPETRTRKTTLFFSPFQDMRERGKVNLWSFVPGWFVKNVLPGKLRWIPNIFGLEKVAPFKYGDFCYLC